MITISPEKEDDGIWTSYTYNFTKAERKKAKKVRLQPKSEKKQSAPLEEMLKIPKTPTRTIKSEYKFEENKGKQPENEVNKLQPPREMFQIPKESNNNDETEIYEENLQALKEYLKSNPIPVPSKKHEVKNMREFVGDDFPLLKAALDIQWNRLKNEKSVVSNSQARENVNNKSKEPLGQIFVITIDKKTKKISNFPKEARFLICKEIFNSLSKTHKITDLEILEYLVRNLKTQNRSLLWIREIANNELDEISKKLKDNKYKSALTEYLKELIRFINFLKKLNEDYIKNPIPISVREVGNLLFEKGITLGMTQKSLEFTLPSIIDYLKHNIEDFKLERITIQRLFDDKNKRLKECGRCHRILPYEEFEEYKGEKRKGLRSVCRECRLALQLIKRHITKAKIILNEFEGKCSKCGIGMVFLPALEFHHLKDKNFAWSQLMDKSYEDAVEILKNEDVIVLCKNCHELEQSKTYNIFRDLIIRPNLFSYSSNELNEKIKKIYQEKANEENEDLISDIRLIHHLIKKRFVLEQLYNGSCIGCNKVTVYSNLPALDLHHSEPEKTEVKSRWQNLKFLDSEDIMKTLIDEQCVCLCSNCHRLLHSRFNELAEEIFSQLNIPNKNELLMEITNFFNDLFENISNFSFKLDKINFKSPLKLEGFPRYETWKLRLLQIFYFTLKKGLKHFRVVDLRDFFDEISEKNLYSFINKFKDQGIIEVVEEKLKEVPRKKVVKFSEYGLKTIKKIESEYPNEAKELKEYIFESYRN